MLFSSLTTIQKLSTSCIRSQKMSRKRSSVSDLVVTVAKILSSHTEQASFKDADAEVLKTSIYQLKSQITSSNPQLQRAHYNEFTRAILTDNTLVDIVNGLIWLDFDSRKSLISLIAGLAHRSSSCDPADDTNLTLLVNYILSHQDLLDVLLDGYKLSQPFHVTTILCEYIKVYPIAETILLFCAKEQFQRIFSAMSSPNFDVSSDASVVLKDLLTKHEQLTATFLDQNPQFFTWFCTLLHSSNYATRRFSLNLLSTLLLNRANFNAMSRFVESDENLKLIMRLLKDDSAVIRFEAFHVFKVFVANPKKTEPVLKILKRNKDKLIEHLLSFTTETNSSDFEEEKGFIVDSISDL